eukprot:TRINITY_DN55094_c0_g1_i1.p1 TRINITY_DN55094_c0_g1~~TRINITY_DN55094_c0_g1_i1.p1  ORF type:complete len:706 (-),score=195.55 TRINITY_DN55094_c0_g1_i1:78-2195(-)
MDAARPEQVEAWTAGAAAAAAAACKAMAVSAPSLAALASLQEAASAQAPRSPSTPSRSRPAAATARPPSVGVKGSSGSNGSAGRRLDLLEARVLSNWHEFMVHRQEVQVKLQDLYAHLRSGTRPRAAAGAQHLAELDRRVGGCERHALEALEGQDGVLKQLSELRHLSGNQHDSSVQAFEKLRECVVTASQEAAEALRAAGELHVEVRGRTYGLNQVVEDRTQRLHAEAVEMLRRSHRDFAVSANAESDRVERRFRKLEIELQQSTATVEAAVEARLVRVCHAESTEASRVLEHRLLQRNSMETAVAVQAMEGHVERRLRDSRSEAVAEALKQAAADVAASSPVRRRSEAAMAADAAESAAENYMRRSGSELRAAMEAVRSTEASLQRQLRSHSVAEEALEVRLAKVQEELARRSSTWVSEDRLSSELATLSEQAPSRVRLEAYVDRAVADIWDDLRLLRRQLSAFGNERSSQRFEAEAIYGGRAGGRSLSPPSGDQRDITLPGPSRLGEGSEAASLLKRLQEVESQVRRLRSAAYSPGATPRQSWQARGGRSPSPPPAALQRHSEWTTSEANNDSVAETAAVAARGAVARVGELAALMSRLQREMQEETARVEHAARRFVQEEVDRRLADSQWLIDQRLEKLNRSAEQNRLADAAQRNELWKEVMDLRGVVGELRLKCNMSSSVGNSSGRVGLRPASLGLLGEL